MGGHLDSPIIGGVVNWEWATLPPTQWVGPLGKKFYVGWERVWPNLQVSEGRNIWWFGIGGLILRAEGGNVIY